MPFRLLYDIPSWIILALIKLGLAIIGLVAVALSLVGGGVRQTPKMWRLWADVYGTKFAGDFKAAWWEFAIRNPVRGMKVKHPTEWEQIGDIDESKPGLQWRYRYSGLLASFRVAWGEPRQSEGKREFYIGWKIGSTSPCKFTAQLRR